MGVALGDLLPEAASCGRRCTHDNPAVSTLSVNCRAEDNTFKCEHETKRNWLRPTLHRRREYGVPRGVWHRALDLVFPVT